MTLEEEWWHEWSEKSLRIENVESGRAGERNKQKRKQYSWWNEFRPKFMQKVNWISTIVGIFLLLFLTTDSLICISFPFHRGAGDGDGGVCVYCSELPSSLNDEFHVQQHQSAFVRSTHKHVAFKFSTKRHIQWLSEWLELVEASMTQYDSVFLLFSWCRCSWCGLVLLHRLCLFESRSVNGTYLLPKRCRSVNMDLSIRIQFIFVLYCLVGKMFRGWRLSCGRLV